MTEMPESLSTVFAASSAGPVAPFEYGWCYTDWKDGKNIAAEHRSHDYLQEEPYASQIKNILQQLGLPMPKPQEIFRGTHHDMLFLNSHGLVVRIGPTNVEDLMNPGFLQPLGWLETDLKVKNNMPERFAKFASQKEEPLVVALYPGIELYDNWEKATDRPGRTGDLKDFLRKSGQACEFDVSKYNKGIIRVADDAGKEVAVEILLDAENEWNPSSDALAQRRTDSLRGMELFFHNKADAISEMMRDVFDMTDEGKYLQRAFEAHQPLRRLFWEAFGNVKTPADLPDAAQRAAFWQACGRVTNHPETAVLPCWRRAPDAEGKPDFIQEEIYVPQVVLYRQWTKEAADRAIQPLGQTPELRAAVQKAYQAHRPTGPSARPQPQP